MANTETHFDGVANEFADYADTVRGHIRYELTHLNLAPFLGETALKVADIGGGTAIDAVWLVQQGHEVTIVEPSEEQVAKAEERKKLLSNEEKTRLAIVNSTADAVRREGLEARFDVVLSHGVAMYIPDYKGFIWSLAALTKPGGHVSLLEKGFEGQRERMQKQQKSAREIASFERSQTVRNNIGRPVHAFYPGEIAELLESAGMQVREWSGVRIGSDRDMRKVSDLVPEELDTIVAKEYQLGHDLNHRGRGQMLHIIAQKL